MCYYLFDPRAFSRWMLLHRKKKTDHHHYWRAVVVPEKGEFGAILLGPVTTATLLTKPLSTTFSSAICKHYYSSVLSSRFLLLFAAHCVVVAVLLFWCNPCLFPPRKGGEDADRPSGCPTCFPMYQVLSWPTPIQKPILNVYLGLACYRGWRLVDFCQQFPFLIRK